MVDSSAVSEDLVFPRSNQSEEHTWKSSFGSVRMPRENVKHSSVDGQCQCTAFLVLLAFIANNLTYQHITSRSAIADNIVNTSAYFDIINIYGKMVVL